jgi:hypothetical protein
MSASPPQVKVVPVQKSAKPPKLREARFDDYAQAAALARKFELDAEEYPAWTNLWTDNPAYGQIQGRFPMGWVLESADGAMAGYLGNIPLMYELEGRRLLAATTRSWVVDSAYRSYSLLLVGTYFQQPNVDLFLATSVNSQSAMPLSVFQCARVPVGAWERTLFWITNPQGFSESYFRKKGWAAARALSYPTALGMSLCDYLRGSRFRDRARDVAVVSCADFDGRFDAFWMALRQAKSAVLLGVRNREVLKWHFKFALLRNEAWIYTVEDRGNLAAYGVFLRQDRSLVGLKRVCLADFQCLDQEKAPDILVAMLREAYERCRRESVHMLELVGVTPFLERATTLASPHQRQLPAWMYYYKTNDRALSAKLQNASLWEPSIFDGDSSL